MPALDAAFASSLATGGGGGGEVSEVNAKTRGVDVVDASFAARCAGATRVDVADNVLGGDAAKCAASLSVLAGMKRLKHLNLANNDLPPGALAAFGGAGGGGDAAATTKTKKKRRDDENKKRERAAADDDTAVTALRVLNVSGNRLDSLDGIESLTNLAAIIANDNAIESLAPLRGLKALNTVVLSSNAVDAIADELASGASQCHTGSHTTTFAW